MTVMPFICLAIGFLLTIKTPSATAVKTVDGIINAALILLMVTIGLNIGINDSVIKNLGTIGLNCAIIALCAIAGSVLCVFLLEKTLLPLEKIREKVMAENLGDGLPEDLADGLAETSADGLAEDDRARGGFSGKGTFLDKEGLSGEGAFSDEGNFSEEGSSDNIQQEQNSEGKSHLIWIMPTGIVAGVLAGYFFLSANAQGVLDKLLLISLVFLYTGVGFSMGTNKSVFKYIKKLGFKIILISVAIFIGSAVGGMIAGLLCGEPPEVWLMSSCGMSYYSITGAYMTQSYGIEIGTYGFVVNVMREFFTIILMPLLIKISKGSPIAGGAAGNMDTMLVPVTKFVGVELGVVALITGVILTIAVPVLLPLLAMAIA